MNNPLDDIVKCHIDISSPTSNDAAFDKILLVVSAPESTGKKTMKKATAISKADELLDYGFTTEDAAYVAATVAFAQSPSPTELYVCIRQMVSSKEETDIEEMNVEETGTEGTDTEEPSTDESNTEEILEYETVSSTLARANAEVAFYGLHLTEFRDADDIAEAIVWAEANEKLFGFEYIDYENCPIKNFSYYRSFGIYSGNASVYDEEEQPKENEYAALAWMAKCFGYDPGTETWHLKELATIVPSTLSTEQKKTLKEKHINTFLRYSGANCTIGGYTLAGEWIDVIRFRDWLKAEMQLRVFAVEKANRKVPFTDKGIGLIEGAMESTLKDGQDIGGIAPTEFDENDKEIQGFKVTVPKAMDLTEAERKSRKLTGCYYTARLAGAIHLVEIEGYLTF